MLPKCAHLLNIQDQGGVPNWHCQYKFWKSKADYSYEETAAGGEEVKGSVWRNAFAFCVEL